MSLNKGGDQAGRGTPRGAGGPRSKDEARVVVVRSIPMIEISDMCCRRLTCDRRELIS